MIINEYNGQEMYWKDIVSKFPNTIVCLSNYVDINKTDFRGTIESIVSTIQERDAETIRIHNEGKKMYWKRTTNPADAAEVVELWEVS